MSGGMGLTILTCLFLFSPCTFGDFLQSFALDEVALTPGSLYHNAMSINTEYMLMLDVDDLLLTFRLNAKMPARGTPFVGSWEDPGCEVRGQFMGHYLSALAMLAKHTGIPHVKEGLETLAHTHSFLDFYFEAASDASTITPRCHIILVLHASLHDL